MKKLVLLVAVALISAISFSQGPLSVGKNQLNVGVGLSGWGVPIYIGLDHGISRDLTIGGEFSFRSYNENWNNNEYNHNIVGISANLNYHFNTVLNIPNQWDFYAGPNLGFYSWSSPDTYEGSNNSGLGFGAQIGGRYYLSNKIGLNFEFGSGNAFSGGKFGLTFKL